MALVVINSMPPVEESLLTLIERNNCLPTILPFTLAVCAKVSVEKRRAIKRRCLKIHSNSVNRVSPWNDQRLRDGKPVPYITKKLFSSCRGRVSRPAVLLFWGFILNETDPFCVENRNVFSVYASRRIFFISGCSSYQRFLFSYMRLSARSMRAKLSLSG